jgi:peroxiredoxin
MRHSAHRIESVRLLLASCVVLFAAYPLAAGEAVEPDRVGRQIEGFELRDFYGKSHQLSDYAKAKAVVVAFLGTDCPLVKLYTPRLIDLAKQYEGKGVAFLAINSNHQDTVTEISAFARRLEVPFPILKDPDSAVADQFQAVRTPEVFVLDGQRVVRYWGRIDDQYGIGFQKKEPARRDLAQAIDETLAGKPVSVAVTSAPGCLIGRTQKVAPHGDITYTKHIAGIMQNRCVECHREKEIAPFPLTNYDEVVGWADMICEVIDQGRMPPWFADPRHGEFKNDARMTDEEKELIHQWVDNGCPEGHEKDLPEPRQFVEGWRIGEPDAVYYMDDKPYDVPAEGVVEYKHFEVDPQFTEDKWIVAAEARPGNPGVVHHIIVFVQRPGNPGGGFSEGAQIGYAPGMPPRDFEKGQAMLVPAGSKLVFQMHYTPNGVAAQDRSYVGFKFCDKKDVQQRVKGAVCGNFSFEIPPGDGNYEVKARKRIRRDTLLVSMLPHMHLRGKDFKFELEYPDGRREVLLDVPKYDFNWQLWYNCAEPKLLPKGSKLYCTAHFDNSEENPFNPDPSDTVTWGEQTFEEMMFGFMSVIDPKEDVNKLVEEEEVDEDFKGRRVAF